MSPTPIELREIGKVIRRDVLTMILEAGSGHVGGSLSAADIMVVLYWQVLRDEARPADLGGQGPLRALEGARGARVLRRAGAGGATSTCATS